jgi:hypothetical protein
VIFRMLFFLIQMFIVIVIIIVIWAIETEKYTAWNAPHWLSVKSGRFNFSTSGWSVSGNDFFSPPNQWHRVSSILDIFSLEYFTSLELDWNIINQFPKSFLCGWWARNSHSRSNHINNISDWHWFS